MAKHVTEKNKTPFYIRVSFDGLREKFYYFKDIETLKIAKDHINTLLRCYYLRTRAHKDAIEASEWNVNDSKMVIEYTFNATIDEYEYFKLLYIFLPSHIRFTQKAFEKEGNQILKLHLINTNTKPLVGSLFERDFETSNILFFLPRKGDLNALVERIVTFAKERYNITLSDISLEVNDDDVNVEYIVKEYAGIYTIERYKHVSFINNLYCEVYPQFKRGEPLPPITSNIELMAQDNGIRLTDSKYYY